MLNYVIGTLSSLTAAALVAGFLWAKRHWIVNALAKINWKLSGDMWWLCCDLHSIKLQAEGDRITKMHDAIKKAQDHAERMRMDDQVLSGIVKLKDTYSAKQTITTADKKQIEAQVDAIIDYCGKLAEGNQPDFESNR